MIAVGTLVLVAPPALAKKFRGVYKELHLTREGDNT